MPTQRTILRGVSLASFAALTACGATVHSPNAAYTPFDNTTEQATSQLTGKAFGFSDAITPVIGIGPATGTLQHDTGAMTLQSPGGTISDADGRDGNGDISDDANAPSLYSNATIGNNAYTGTYEFVQPFTQSGGGQTFGFGGAGIIGMGTDDSDMPATGSATFTGEAMHGYGGSVTPATVSANFGTGLVDANTSITTGGITEDFALTGMAIAGNELSGGTLTVTHNGTVVDGTSFGLTTGGEFYGYDTATGGPDEVGVLFSHAGSDSTGLVTIIAD